MCFDVLTDRDITNELLSSSDCESLYHKTIMTYNHNIFAETISNDSALFYKQVTPGRNSSYPFISGDTFRAFADHVFDETSDHSLWQYHMGKIRAGDIVFVQSAKENLDNFFVNDIFKRITVPFILITHNSDELVPSPNHTWILENQRVVAWFTQNPRIRHEKLFPIPIGLANHRWPHGDVNTFKKAFRTYLKPFSARKTFLYVNMQLNTNREERSKALEWAKTLPYVKWGERVDLEHYLKDLGDSKYVLSPPGNGIDCHRTWESMLMGAVPILLRSPIESLFVEENALVIENWYDLNYSYLKLLFYEQKLSSLLSARYWHEKLENLSNTIRFNDSNSNIHS